MLIESELIKRNKTRQAIPGFYNFEPSLYNLLLRMPFCTGKLADDNDIELIKLKEEDVHIVLIIDLKKE